MRQCPTLEGEGSALITHLIGVGACLSRQRGFYHKCHRCVYRGQPASFMPPERPPLVSIDESPVEADRNGAVEPTPVEVPASKVKPAAKRSPRSPVADRA